MNRMPEVLRSHGENSALRKLAEECSELSAAALKLVCVSKGESPMSEKDAREDLVEEMGDVLVEFRLVRHMLTKEENNRVNLIASQKEQRMYKRLLKEQKQ